MIFACCGRSSELKCTTYDHFKFDSEFRCLVVDWTQCKTSKPKNACIFTDADDFVLDVYHAMFCYLTNTMQKTSNSNFVFDELDVSQASDKIQRDCLDYFRNECQYSRSLGKKFTTKGLRVGPANIIADRVGINAAIQCGGWDLTNMSASFEYFIQVLTSSRAAGRVLAGYPVPGYGGCAPLLSDLPVCDPLSVHHNSDISRAMDSLLTSCLGRHDKFIDPVKSALFSAFLRHARAYHAKYPTCRIEYWVRFSNKAVTTPCPTKLSSRQVTVSKKFSCA